MIDKIKIKDLIVFYIESNEFSGVSISGKSKFGYSKKYLLKGPDGLSVKIHDVTWSNDERDIRSTEVDGTQSLKRAAHGLRLEVKHKNENIIMTLRQARIKKDSSSNWSNLKIANEKKLNEGAGLNVRKFLMNYGALEIGTRLKLLGDRSSKKNCYCVICHKNNEAVPLLAYILTRIIP